MPNDNEKIYPEEERPHNPMTTQPAFSSPDRPMPSDATNYPVPTHRSFEPELYGGRHLPIPDRPPKRGNFWRTATMVMTVTTLIFIATTVLAYDHIINPPASTTTSVPPVVATHAPTSGTTQSTSTATPSSQQQPGSNNYSAPQPGPGCDKNGGIWTPQGIGNITCGTQVAPSAAGTWGYLYLQLPNNIPFSTSNKITVTGNVSSNSLDCVGLDEQDASTGYLVSYCASGAWAVSSISDKGIITNTLLNNVTSTKTNTTISLSLSGNTLVFTIDSETHQVTVSPIQPVKAAIAYEINSNCTSCFIPSIMTSNFSYITPAS